MRKGEILEHGKNEEPKWEMLEAAVEGRVHSVEDKKVAAFATVE